MNSSPVEYAPLQILHKALSRWWLVALLFLLGALAGWLVQQIQPKTYEARAAVLTTIDFSSIGPITQFEEDLMMDAVGWVLQSTDVLDRVAARATQENILPLDRAAFFKMTTLERRLGTWELRVRASSPQVSRDLANLWLDEGNKALLDAYRHTGILAGLTSYAASLEACLAQSSISETSSVLCRSSDLPALQAEMQRVSGEISIERYRSRGLISGILIGDPRPADLPAQPVTGGRGIFLLAGGLIGLLAGFALSSTRIRVAGREL